MRLDEYLNLVGQPPYTWAQTHGIHRDSVYRVLQGRGRDLKLETAVRISEATKGAVSPAELLQPPVKLKRGRRPSQKNKPKT